MVIITTVQTVIDNQITTNIYVTMGCVIIADIQNGKKNKIKRGELYMTNKEKEIIRKFEIKLKEKYETDTREDIISFFG